MAIDKNAFYKYQETRAQSGLGAAILVKTPSQTKYSLLVASETVPSIFGTTETFEFDLLNSPTKGKVEGKQTLDEKEVQVLHHRDNVYRFEKLKNQTLDFLVVDSQFVGYKFSGTLSYRMNDATADVLYGTYTITPMSADPTPILNVRDIVQETLCFNVSVPETMKPKDQITLSVVQEDSDVSYSLVNDKSGNIVSTAIAGNVLTIPESQTSGLYVIKAQHSGYADAFTTIYIDGTPSV